MTLTQALHRKALCDLVRNATIFCTEVLSFQNQLKAVSVWALSTVMKWAEQQCTHGQGGARHASMR